MSKVVTDIEELRRAFRSNADHAIDAVYKEYRKAFINFAKSYNLPDDEVIDVFQETVIALYQNLQNDRVEKRQSSVKTYLFAIGKYKLINASKKQQRKTEQNGMETIENKESSTMHLNLQQSLRKLGDSCREILTLYYYRQYSIDAIMHTLSLKNENTVKAAKSRCLKKLKEIIKNTSNVG
ncbi:MAG: sigma-70 family RNA polymerase sigma factor [Bacteroidota bacterium]